MYPPGLQAIALLLSSVASYCYARLLLEEVHHGDQSTCGRCPHRVDNSWQRAVTSIAQNILAANDSIAQAIQQRLAALSIHTINMMSSPGAGKTALLVRTIERLRGQLGIGVIEGDVETSADAERIEAAGAQAVQINTRGACHLEAHMIRDVLAEIDLAGPACQAEYDDPRNRRFHAQPNTCPICGPQVRLLAWNEGTMHSAPPALNRDPFTGAAQRLAARAILAIKGLGGYHLACDALNGEAVHQRVPPNDGGLSLGQLAVTAARLQKI